MLKYIIAFCFISFCDSAHNEERQQYVSQLVLSIRFAVTSLFYGHIPYSTNSDEFSAYIEDHKTTFKEEKWIIQGFWAVDSDGRTMTTCVDSNNHAFHLNTILQDDSFQNDLREKWPASIEDGRKMGIWSMAIFYYYLQFGSCVDLDQANYFHKALNLYNLHDIKEILENASINPGDKYEFYLISNAVTRGIRKRVNLKCLQVEETQKQYLLDIEICLKVNGELTDCLHQTKEDDIHHCKDTWVEYPPVPEGYL